MHLVRQKKHSWDWQHGGSSWLNVKPNKKATSSGSFTGLYLVAYHPNPQWAKAADGPQHLSLIQHKEHPFWRHNLPPKHIQFCQDPQIKMKVTAPQSISLRRRLRRSFSSLHPSCQCYLTGIIIPLISYR